MIAIRRPEVAVDHLRRLTESRARAASAALNALGVAYDLLGEHALATADLPPGPRHGAGLDLAAQQSGLVPGAAGAVRRALVELLRPIAEGPGSTRRTRQNLALVYGLQGDLGAAERLSRVDLGGRTLQQPGLLRDRAGHRGADRAGRGAGAGAVTSAEEPRLTRKSRAVAARAAPPATPGCSPPRCRRPPGRPSRQRRPAARGHWRRSWEMPAPDPAASGGWFVDVGSFAATAAAEQWRELRAKHASAMAGVGRLASAGAGIEPMLVGPLASEQAASSLCVELGTDVQPCRPMQLSVRPWSRCASGSCGSSHLCSAKLSSGDRSRVPARCVTKSIGPGPWAQVVAADRRSDHHHIVGPVVHVAPVGSRWPGGTA